MALAAVLTTYNEADTLPAALDSLRPLCEVLYVHDFGSSDKSASIARDAGASVTVSEWDGDWTTVRGRVGAMIRAARGHADYALAAKAYETFELKAELPPLTAPYYRLPNLHDSCAMVFYDDRLFDTQRDWEWVGEGSHGATLTTPFYEERGMIDSLLVRARGGLKSDEKRAEYRASLEQWLTTHPLDSRVVFYLACEYRDAHLWHQASSLYQRRIGMSEGDEEQWYSMMMAGVCELHIDFGRGSQMLLAAFAKRPTRAEPLRYLERASVEIADRIPYPQSDTLFVELDAYVQNPWREEAKPKS